MAAAWEADAIVTPAGKAPAASPWAQDEMVTAAPKAQAKTPEAKPAAKDSWAKNLVVGTLENAGALADVVLSFPGAVIGGMGTATFAAIGALKGEQDQKALWQGATEFGRDVAEDNPLAHPVKSIMEWAGYKDGYSNSAVVKTLDKFSSFIQKGGDYAEAKLGIPAEAVNALTEQLTNLGMMKGGELVGRKLGLTKPEAPKPPAQPAVPVGGVAAPALAAEEAHAATINKRPPPAAMGAGMTAAPASQLDTPKAAEPTPPLSSDKQQLTPPADTPPSPAPVPSHDALAPLGAMSLPDQVKDLYNSLPQNLKYKMVGQQLEASIKGSTFHYEQALALAEKASGASKEYYLQQAKDYEKILLKAQEKIKTLLGEIDGTTPGPVVKSARPELQAKPVESGEAVDFAAGIEAPKAPEPVIKTPEEIAARQAEKARFNFKNTDNWKKTGDQKGSNEGGSYTAPDGTDYYVKSPKTEDHARNELLAGDLYDLAGIAVARTHAVTHDGKPSVASKYEKGLSKITFNTPGVTEGFAVDAWLANHDVIGLAFDNIHRDSSGKAFRLDLGGALRYRAQGEPKKLSPTVSEFGSMRDSSVAPQAAKFFGKMTGEELIASIKKVQAVSPDDIEALVKAKGPKDPVVNKQLVDTLIARRADLIKKMYALEDKIAGKPAAPAPEKFPQPDYSKYPTHKATQAEYGVGEAGQIKQQLPAWDDAEFPQWLKDITQTPTFKAFYEKSIFKDAQGNPIVRYHGTNKHINAGKGFLAFKQSNSKSIGKGKGEAATSGIFTASTFENAIGSPGAKGNGVVMPVFVAAERPFDYLKPAHVAAVEKKAQQMGIKWDPHFRSMIEAGGYNYLEDAKFLRPLRNLRNAADKSRIFDSYFTSEDGSFGNARNLASLERTAVKSIYNPAKFSPKNPNIYGVGAPSLLATIAGTGTVALATYKATNDPYEAGLFAIGAAGLGALLTKHGGMAPTEFSALGTEYWKPDFATMLDPRYLGRALQWTKQATTADTTVLWQNIKNARVSGLTEALDKKFRDVSEGSIARSTLTASEDALYERHVMPLKAAIAEQLNKILDPIERRMVAEEVETRAAKNHFAWWDAITNGSEGTGPRGFQKTASAAKARSVFALQDGTIITIKPMRPQSGMPGAWKVTAWSNNVRTDLGITKEHLTKGSDFAGQKVVSAKQADIEMHTPIRYVSSDMATHSLKLAELMKYTREKELVDNLLQSPAAQGLFVHQKYGQIPPGFVQPEGAMSIPSLQGVFMPKEYAEVFGDFIKKNRGSQNLLEGAKNIMIRAMMLNPYAHIMNEMVHWYDSRGLSGFITPTGIPGAASKGLYGMAVTMPDAIRSVILQDKFQIEMQKTGGFLLYPAVKNQRAWNNILQTTLGQAVKTGSFKEMAVALGTSPVRLAKRISDMGSSIMWATRDIMYTQLVKEQVMMGKSMEEAIKETGKHMPEYYIPSRIIADNAAGRVASKTLQSPLLVFSSYHYGMVKAVKEIGKDITSGKLGHMTAGADRAAAIIAAMAVLYPVLDQINQGLTGQDEAKQRRAGIYHIFNSVGEAVDGKRDATSIVSALLTPNPAMVTAVEELQNHYLWSGQPIRYEGTSATTQALMTGKHLISKLKPAQTMDDVVYQGRKSWEQAALAELDIQARSQEQIDRADYNRELRKEAGQRKEEKFKQTYGIDE